MNDLVLSVHPAIRNKPPAWLPEYADNWQRCETTFEDLAELIANGYAFIPAAMASQRRSSSAFRHADLVVIDIDEGLDLDAFRQHPMAAHAALLYTTSSHRPEPGRHRFRVIFRLRERISDPELYKALVTLLIREFGGDKSCSDPCRLFYGCSTGEQQWLHPDQVLPDELLRRARELVRQQKQRLEATGDYDDIDIGQAIHVLEEVLEPTADGERDRFIRITAAAASAGADLYPAWSDWASRGHHGSGKNARQASERFFRGFSGRSSLATLFFLAGEQDPDWRRSLPDHLRKSSSGPAVPAAGYSMADFMGSEEDLDDLDPDQRPSRPAMTTPSIVGFDWEALRRTKEAIAAAAASDNQQAAPATAQTAALPGEPPPLPPEIDDPDDPFEGLGLELIYGDEVDPPPDKEFDPSGDPLKKAPGKKGSRKKGDALEPLTIPVVKAAVRDRYPSLRLNTLTYKIEYGPTREPKEVSDPTMAYVPVSERAGRNMPKQTVTDVVRILAEENAYNPVQAYLEYCHKTAGPIDYFDELAQVLLGVTEESPDNPRLPCGSLYADEVLRRFLVGAVARTLNPGCPHSWMLILVGPQNLGKSNFFQYLTPPCSLNSGYPWVTTIQQGISYLKEKPHALHAGWLVLLDEVERYFKRQYTEELKNLISVANDRSARKYENERSFPRSFVLCGATNSMNFMVDPTGNRRFMPIRVPGKVPAPEDPSIRIIDLDRVKRDRNRIWAAAYQAYLDNPVHEFTSYELTRVEGVHGIHSLDSPLEGSLRAALAKECSFLHKGQPCYTMAHIFDWLNLNVDRSSAMTRPISDELRRMGYENAFARIQGIPTRFWRKRR